MNERVYEEAGEVKAEQIDYLLTAKRKTTIIITDSLHACVFSTISEKTFEVFEQNYTGEKGNMNNRIYDFFEEYQLKS